MGEASSQSNRDEHFFVAETVASFHKWIVWIRVLKRPVSRSLTGRTIS